MRINSNTILTGVIIVLGIIMFVGGLRYIFDFNPTRDSTYENAIGGSILVYLGLAPFIYGIATSRDYILHRKEKEKDEETKI